MVEAFPFLDWSFSIIIGFLVVSYWRCTWVLMDLWHCKQPQEASLAEGDSFCLLVPAIDDPDTAQLRAQSATVSYLIGIGCLALGVFIIWMGWWVPLNNDHKVTPGVAVVRFCAIYVLGFSAVHIWRGIWYWADDWILPDQPLKSYWATSLAGSSLCFLLWGGNSLLAPPAIFLLDGPGLASPPVAVTLLSTYYAITLPADGKPPELSLPAKVLDVLTSFILLPFGVVWFWRGTWMLLDNYLWGFTPSNQDVNMSILWSLIMACIIYIITSEPVMGFTDKNIKSNFVMALLGRLRTYILAWGTVAFWRMVWYIWDQFLGGTTYVSAGVGHVVSILILTAMGCVSSIVAPASTVGVDSVPHEDAADEPLFSMVPVPYEALSVLGIARQPEETTVTLSAFKSIAEIEMGTVNETSQQTMDVSAINKRPVTVLECVKEGETLTAESAEKDYDPGSTIMTATGVAPEMTASEKEYDPGSTIMTPAVVAAGMTTSVPPFSSARGWQSEGSFRNYSDLQRFGSIRAKSEYFQRPGSGNKRNRSKFYRSRRELLYVISSSMFYYVSQYVIMLANISFQQSEGRPMQVS